MSKIARPHSLPIGIVAIVALCLLYTAIAGLLGFAADYAISFWLKWAGRPDNFKWVHGFLICLIPGIGQLSLPAAIITFVISFFL